MEIWRDIEDYEGLYQISNLGRIASVKRVCKTRWGNRIIPFKILKPNDGRVRICKNGIMTRICINEFVNKYFHLDKVEDLLNEEWVKISGFGELYFISNYGRVKSVSKTLMRNNGINQYYPERIIKSSIINSGYKTIRIHAKEGSRSFLVHRLVAEYFVPNPDSCPCVNHIDEDKNNNHFSNLEWCTAKYNNNYGTKTKRQWETRRRNMALK